MAERVFPARVFEGGGGQIIPSPNQFYLTGEDRLRVVSVNSAAGVRITIACRTAPPAGGTVAQQFTHVPTTDRSKRTEDFSIGDGSLLNVTVFAGAGTPLIGQTYVIVQIVRGAGAAAVVLGTVLAGYITTLQALGFPGSPILSSTAGEPCVRSVTATVPAAGVDFGEVCPTGARWDLLRVFAALTTAAVFGSRWVQFRVHTSGMRTVTIPPALSQPDTQYEEYQWAGNLPISSYYQPNLLQQAIPTPLILNAGDFFFTTTIFKQAADQWSAITYVVREWLEVP